MKKLTIAAFALTAAVGALAQGTVYWASYGDGVHTYHYWGQSATVPGLSLTGPAPNDTPVGTTPYEPNGMIMIGAPGGLNASTTFAQLLWANGANQPLSSLVPGGQTTTFRTGNAAGLLVPVPSDTIIGLTPDSAAATFAMVAWDNSSGQYPTWTQASVGWMNGTVHAGMSMPFNVLSIGGSVNTEPVVMAPSFNIWWVPEPSTFALAGLGAAALLSFRRRK